MHKLTGHKYVNAFEHGITFPPGKSDVYMVCADCGEPAPWVGMQTGRSYKPLRKR